MKEKKIVKVGNIEAGKDELFLISGPCVIEDESIMLKTAEHLKKVEEKNLWGFNPNSELWT